MTEQTADPVAAYPEPTEAEIIADLDPGIRDIVILLREHGVDTGESCQGGPGHSYSHPVIHFGGDEHAGLRALWLLESAGHHVDQLVRIWDLNAGGFACWRVDLWPLPEGGSAPEPICPSCMHPGAGHVVYAGCSLCACTAWSLTGQQWISTEGSDGDG